ncbi:NAD(P)-binding protein [Ascobolus immersus RN42]|uniref:NAD(P)-binding protein n=1 Tax=Ascobolus immersus RN42 TaxID=1160509 RepID=A0A3N4IQE8_ASCIM|nr:NAD(P)-binding protein [Ascobolus immersus RN42]
MAVDDKHLYVLVTGANSGLGFGILHRLIDSFLLTYPPDTHLTLLFTCRSHSKKESTLSDLLPLLSTTHGSTWSNRVKLSGRILDLTSLVSIHALSTELHDDYDIPRLDAVIWNAGMAALSGLDWLTFAKGFVCDTMNTLTYGHYKTQIVGARTKAQLEASSTSTSDKTTFHTSSPNGNSPTDTTPEDSTLGEVFCANTFGHYLLTHLLTPLLAASKFYGPTSVGRIIWVSSLEAFPRFFSTDDIQGLRSTSPYESSKRLTDILSVTSTLPAAEPFVQTFLPTEHNRPRQILTHPGVCATSIVTFLPMVLVWCMKIAFLLAKYAGSEYHTTTPYSGAKAMVFAVLARDEEIRGDVKYGSGNEKIGWFKCRDVLREEKVDFPTKSREEVAHTVWREMELLRVRFDSLRRR